MDFWLILYIIDWVLFGLVALTVLYMLFFAFMSLFYHKPDLPKSKHQNRFIVLIPTYKNPDVIYTVKSILGQTYPQRLFDVTVIADQCDEMTNFRLAQEPVTLLTPQFEKSTKAKELQLAINNLPQFKIYDIVIVLDGGSVVEPEFLELANDAFEAAGTKAIQMHRLSRNRDTATARLGAVFEEINNSVFRRGHVALGLSAGLSGGGNAYDFNWFKENIFKVKTPWEVKEIEALLVRQHIYVDFFDQVYVFDEKKRTSEAFNKERKRWIKAHYNAFFRNLMYLPGALLNQQYNLIDKIIQWMILPRLVMMVIIILMSIILPMVYMSLVCKWWAIFAVVLFIFALATPDYLVDDDWDSTFFKTPLIFMKTIPGLSKIADRLEKRAEVRDQRRKEKKALKEKKKKKKKNRSK